MARGPAGYGRYDDDPDQVGCPRARSDMTPCIARDGAICLAGETPKANGVCVGCGADPRALLHDLDPVANRALRAAPPSVRAREAADLLADTVRQLTEPLASP